MKDSQHTVHLSAPVYKYIKADNERFSTSGGAYLGDG